MIRKKSSEARVPFEAQEQKALFEWAAWARRKYPALDLMFAIPNGGTRNPVEAHHLKEQGVKPGVPDICLPVPNAVHSALYIELKRRKGGRVSEEQHGWMLALNRVGNLAVVCKGWEEARDVILEYLRH